MADTSSVRVRFAPSPTGHLHIGSFRTALFNWLFAKHYKGTFLVRIEDTDKERSKQEYVESILKALEWVGLEADEPIMIQSAQSEHHEQVLTMLLAQGKAYKCFCTQDEVVARATNPEFVSYDGLCRTADQRQNRPYAIRFKIPDTLSSIAFTDLVRGPITFDRDQFDDFIIARSDGSPIYNFVVVIDDATMRITHVIRGEDHISNTPKQILIYQACGFSVPQFAHIPLILGPNGDRLSKRDGAVSALEYKKLGYLPAALMNYLVRLGWSHGDQEVFSRQELIDCFTLDAVGKKGSIFDIEKLNWLNGIYIRELSGADILSYIVSEFDPQFQASLAAWNYEKIIMALDTFKSRVNTVCQLIDEVRLLYAGPSSFQDDVLKALRAECEPQTIEALIDFLRDHKEGSLEDLKSELKQLSKKINVKFVAIAHSLRVALLGDSNGPGIYDMVEIVGVQNTYDRLLLLGKALQ